MSSIQNIPVTTIDGKPSKRTPLKGTLSPGVHDVRLEVNGLLKEFSIVVSSKSENKWCYVFESERLLEGGCP